ncbi:hypothetical protein QNH10_20270 [Sporosarcina thermotolerans]|uniref:hypothetical protein n=1 Tax=Sporosarcina thermotolerans TaxID=633404 RepID=UPI0024BC89A5|nr:hypothetical protein [Sporosarcina thermotolerans]WHT48302.1 hypothetical protein QNH10_20270 [Sporosarcina thermotolerans]
MKKYIGSIAIIFTLIFTIQINANAQEMLKTYLISGGEQSELVKYMNENGMQVEKAYSDFDIISASLTSINLIDYKINTLKSQSKTTSHMKKMRTKIYLPVHSSTQRKKSQPPIPAKASESLSLTPELTSTIGICVS